MSLLRIFRADPLLAGLTTLLSAAICLPLFVTPFLPMQDLPDHVGLANLIGDILGGNGLASDHYRVQGLPLPYLTMYVMLAAFGALFGPLFGAKLVVAFTLLCIPLGAMRLMVALKRNPRMGLFAFALVWDHNLYWGWVSYAMGNGLALFALAHLIESTSVKGALLRAGGWAALVALTHAQAFGNYLVLAGAFVFAGAPLRRRFLIHALGLLPGILILVPWAIDRMTAGSGSAAGSGLGLVWHSLPHKLGHLYTYSMGDPTGPTGEACSALAFAIVLLAPLALAGLRRDESVVEDRGAVVAFLAMAGLYLAMPMQMSRPIEQWYIYPREASLLLLAALLVPRPNLTGRWRSLLLLPAVAATTLTCVAVTGQFADFGKRARPFLEIIDKTKADRALLTLTLDDGDPRVRLSVYNQFHAYITATRGGYDPYLFDNPSHVVVFRGERKRPAPAWNRMHEFSMTTHAPHYDYILVQGLDRDPSREGPLPTGQVVQRIAQAGRWRLYEIVKPETLTALPPS